MRIPDRTGDTRQDLRAIARAFRASALSHPQAATLVLTRQLTSLAGLAPVEAVLTVLTDAGYANEEAVHLLRSLVATLIGTLLREVNAGPTFGTTDAPGIAARRQALKATGLPALAGAADRLARFDATAEFDFAVELLIAAILTHGDRKYVAP